MKTLFLVALAVLGSHVAFGSIEAVLAPTANDNRLEILRWALYRDGDVVKYGLCDVLEAECNPETETLKVSREINYEKYQTALAERFQIPPKYLIQHEKGAASYDSYVALLTQIINDKNLPEEERNSAQAKFDNMTQKGGVLDRFTQALALKRGLEWIPNVDVAKEVRERFKLLGKLQARTLVTVSSSPNTDFTRFLRYVSINAQEADTRNYASRFLEKIEALTKRSEDIARDVDARCKVLMKGDRSSVKEAEVMENYLSGIRFSDGIGVTIPEAYDLFKPYLPEYQKSLEVTLAPVTDDEEELPLEPLVKQVYTYEKSVKQFEESLWPMNFAQDQNQKEDSRAEEPSTGKTWIFAGNNLTQLEASRACAAMGNGFSLPDFNRDVVYSAPWLSESALSALITAINGRKTIWTAGSPTPVGRNAKVSKLVNTGYNEKTQKEVTVTLWDYDFPQAFLQKDPRQTTSRVTTQEEGQKSGYEAESAYGNFTAKASAFCVGPTRYESASTLFK